MNSTPFFSVCIPTYNRANLISQAIESTLNQDFADFELIICDNASTDNTRQVIEEYDDRRIRYVRFDSFVSMYANHNRCISLAQTHWLVFLHSDDVIAQNTLSTYKKLIDHRKNIDVIYSPNTSYKFTESCINDPTPHYLITDTFQLYHYIAGASSGAVYSVKTLKKFKFNEEYLLSDFEILIRMTRKNYVIALINQKLVKTPNNSDRTTNKWTDSGQYMIDISNCLLENLSEQVFSSILTDINNWHPKEISHLMGYFAFGGRLDLIKEMVKRIDNRNYKKYSSYRHVFFANILGAKLYRNLYLVNKSAIKYIKTHFKI